MAINKSNIIKWFSVIVSVLSLSATGGVFLYDYLSTEKAKNLKTDVEDDDPNSDDPNSNQPLEETFITYKDLFKNFELKNLLQAFKVRVDNEIEVNEETFKYLYMKEFFKNYKYKSTDLNIYLTFQSASKINIKIDFVINNIKYLSNFWISYII